MLIVVALLLWPVCIAMHVIHYNRMAKGSGVKNNFDLIGGGLAMVSSGLLTYSIKASSKSSTALYAHYVNGVRVSSGAMTGMAVIVAWVSFTAIINLSSMGLAFLLTKKRRK